MTKSEKQSDATTVDDIVEDAKDRVESLAEKSQKYDGEQGAFFAGLRAAYAGVVEEYGTDEDFEEALLRGSEAGDRAYTEDEDR